MNISDHIQHRHQIDKDDERYGNYIKSSKVIPLVFTTKIRGVITKLTGKELEIAQAKHQQQIDDQDRKLKEMNDVRKELSGSNLSSEKQMVLNKKMNDIRHNKSVINHPKIDDWQSSFTSFLKSREYNDPKKNLMMAFTVLQSGFDLSEKISLQELLNPRIIRNTLINFKQHETTNSTSKIKYIKSFQLLIDFITTDIDSPEYLNISDPIEKVARGVDLNQIKHEEDTVLYQLL